MSLAGSVSARRLARHGGAPTLVELLAALPGAIEGESDERRLLAAKNQLEKGLAMINKKIDQRSAVTPAIDLETSTPVPLSLSPATQALVKEVVLVDKDAHKAIPLLMDLDNALAAALKSGALKLVSAEYMRSAEAGDHILRRQDLEDHERKEGIKVFLTATEAVIALRSNGRLIGSLTYGWSAPGSPDEGGHYFAAVQRFLRSADGAHIVGMFWE